MLKMEYNKCLKRYRDMEEWIKTATAEEQEKMATHIVEVINNCNDKLNEIKKTELVAPGEIIGGFKI